MVSTYWNRQFSLVANIWYILVRLLIQPRFRPLNLEFLFEMGKTTEIIEVPRQSFWAANFEKLHPYFEICSVYQIEAVLVPYWVFKFWFSFKSEPEQESADISETSDPKGNFICSVPYFHLKSKCWTYHHAFRWTEEIFIFTGMKPNIITRNIYTAYKKKTEGKGVSFYRV